MNRSMQHLIFAAFFGMMFGVGAYSWTRSENWAIPFGLVVMALYDLYVRWGNEDNVGWPFLSPGAGTTISFVPLWIWIILAFAAFAYIRH